MPGALQLCGGLQFKVKLAKNSNAKPSSLQGSSPAQTTLTPSIFLGSRKLPMQHELLLNL